MTPLTVVVSVLTALVLLIELTIAAVAVTPLVMLVIVLTALDKVLVVPAVMAGLRFNPADAMPLMVAVNVVPASVSALV